MLDFALSLDGLPEGTRDRILQGHSAIDEDIDPCFLILVFHSLNSNTRQYVGPFQTNMAPQSGIFHIYLSNPDLGSCRILLVERI